MDVRKAADVVIRASERMPITSHAEDVSRRIRLCLRMYR